MISLACKSNTVRKTIIVDVTSTPRQALEQVGISTTATIHLNGTQIVGADLNDSFADLGVADDSEAMLISVIKADAAK